MLLRFIICIRDNEGKWEIFVLKKVFSYSIIYKAILLMSYCALYTLYCRTFVSKYSQ